MYDYAGIKTPVIIDEGEKDYDEWPKTFLANYVSIHYAKNVKYNYFSKLVEIVNTFPTSY